MEVLPAAKPMFVRLARRLPIPPALAVSDSDALTPYMSHVVPGCAFWLLTVTDRFVRTSSPPMSTVPGAVQPLCAPRLANFVSPSESIMLTKCPSFPRRSSRSTYSMQAMPWPPNARFFQRSGSTANCCQRCWSVECSPFCGTMKFVSGHIPYSSSGSIECDFREKYWTGEPGVRSPSGMIFVNSFVVADPSQPVRLCGTVVSHAGTTPLQLMLLRVGELLATFVVSITKHLNLAVPSVANLGSASWYADIQARVDVEPPMSGLTMPATGNTFSSVVSQRALFQVSGSQRVCPLCVPAENWPGSAMYWPQNDASPEVTSPAWFVGICSSTLPGPGTPSGVLLRPAAIW